MERVEPDLYERISIHAPREGRDRYESIDAIHADISIHAPREGRDPRERCGQPLVLAISIHAPREGRDLMGESITPQRAVISIHAPREGRDRRVLHPNGTLWVFQSTRPARGATIFPCGSWRVS